MSVATISMREAALDIESALRADLDQMYGANALLRNELEIHKARADRYADLVTWAYKVSREALMIPANRPREGREAREKALCAINRELGAAVR